MYENIDSSALLFKDIISFKKGSHILIKKFTILLIKLYEKQQYIYIFLFNIAYHCEVGYPTVCDVLNSRVAYYFEHCFRPPCACLLQLSNFKCNCLFKILHRFDVLVNGGGAVTLQFQRSPFRPLTRTVFVPWNRILVLPPVQMQLSEEDNNINHNIK